jgi:RNA-binding protein
VTGLTGKQRRQLRALGQQLAATVHVGHEGVTDAVVAHANVELDTHELIKVRIGENAPHDRHEVAATLAERTHAHLAQVLGRTALLYRARPDDPAKNAAETGREQ